MLFHVSLKVRKKANIRNGYNQIQHLTQDTIWESYKNTGKHNIHVQESQDVHPFPAGDQKAIRNRQDRMTDTHETQITRRILEGLNMFEVILCSFMQRQHGKASKEGSNISKCADIYLYWHTCYLTFILLLINHIYI